MCPVDDPESLQSLLKVGTVTGPRWGGTGTEGRDGGEKDLGVTDRVPM